MSAPTPHSFLTTRWSAVIALGSKDPERSRAALSDLCRDAWSPLHAYVRGRGLDADRAADVVQGFLARLVEKRDFGELSPERGRFRAFLLAALRHHLAHELERERAAKRGGGQVHLDIDAMDRFEVAGARDPSPEHAFEREWALALLQRVLDGLADEYRASGKGELFERLKPVLQGGELEGVAALAKELGTTEGALKVAGSRLRKRYGERLRAAIADTVDDPAEVEDELRALLAALARP